MKSRKKTKVERTVGSVPDPKLVFEAGVALGYEIYGKYAKGLDCSIADECWPGFSLPLAVLTLQPILSTPDDPDFAARVPGVAMRFMDGLNQGAEERRSGIIRTAEPLAFSRLLGQLSTSREVLDRQCGFYKEYFVCFTPIEENPNAPASMWRFMVMHPQGNAKFLCQGMLCQGALSLECPLLGPRIGDLCGDDARAGLGVMVELLQKAFGESTGLELTRWKQQVTSDQKPAKRVRASAASG